MAKTPTTKKRPQDVPRRFVELTPVAHTMLTKAAKEMGLTNGAYASAAISYFAERGLDPQSDRVREGLLIQNKISELERVVNSLGNRLFGWLTQHEKNTAGFLRGHENALFTYLKAMDVNIHEHLSGLEETIFMPMMREMFLNSVEGLYGRRLGEQILLKISGREQAEYPAKHREFNQKRDADVDNRWNNFVEKLQPLLGPAPVTTPPTPWPERSKTSPEAAPTTPDSPPSSTF